MQETTDFWVGDRFVRPSLGEIQLGPERVHIEPRSMQVLLALAANPSQVIPKKELIEAVWGEAFVSDEVLTHAIWDLRRAFGDNASDPEFIQTIPKRGYRLIAPVKPTEPMRRRATDRELEAGKRPRMRRAGLALVGLFLLAIVAGVSVWLGRTPEPEPLPVAAAARDVLLLLRTRAPFGFEPWGPRLDRRLLEGLTGLEEMEVRQTGECRADAAGERTFCLEPVLLSITDGAELSLSLRRAGGGQVYASPVAPLTASSDLDAAARELSELIGAYFDVDRDPWANDLDLGPWFNPSRHDPRAVREFLRGVRYVYRFDVGGADSMAVAMATDPDFIAPWVWSTPSIAMAGDAAAMEAQRRELERLYARGDGFEKAMIQWALAILDDNEAGQLLQLEVALEHHPDNRHAINARGMAYLMQEEFERAWIDFERLVRERWSFPGLYPTAAYCAARLGRLEELRTALEAALDFKVVDVNSLAMLRLLAIFDADAEREAELLSRLRIRRKEQPAGLDAEGVGVVAEYLATRAEARGGHESAARLRESAN